MLIIVNDFDPPGYWIRGDIKWSSVAETLHWVTKLVRLSRFNLDPNLISVCWWTVAWIVSVSSPSSTYIQHQDPLFPTSNCQIYKHYMADADSRALFPPRDLERDNPTVVSCLLGYLSSSDGEDSESYKPLALAFRL